MPQFEQALKNVLAVLAGRAVSPSQLPYVRVLRDKPGYLAARPESGRICMRRMERHHFDFAMSMILVSDPLDSAGKIKFEATAGVHD